MKIDKLLIELKNHTKTQDDPTSFVPLCNVVASLKRHFTLENIYVCPHTGTKYKFDELMHEYGLEKSQTSRYLSSYDKYFNQRDAGPSQNNLRSLFKDFSKSKLFELLIVPSSVLESDIEKGIVTAQTTVKDIRKYARGKKPKSAKGNTDDTADEPYDPVKSYELSWWNKHSKSDLLPMIMSLQSYKNILQNKNK